MIDEHPADLIERRYRSQFDPNVWRIGYGHDFYLGGDAELYGWRWTALGIADVPAHDGADVVVGLAGVPIGGTRSVRARCDSDRCTATSGTAPHPDGRCGYHIIRGYGAASAFWAAARRTYRDRHHGHDGVTRVLLRVRALGHVAPSPDPVDPDGTLRVEAFDPVAVLLDSHTASVADHLRRSYPALHLIAAADRSYDQLLADHHGPGYDHYEREAAARRLAAPLWRAAPATIADTRPRGQQIPRRSTSS